MTTNLYISHTHYVWVTRRMKLIQHRDHITLNMRLWWMHIYLCLQWRIIIMHGMNLVNMLKYDGSRLVDCANRFVLHLCDPLVLTISTGEHIDVISGYAISLNLLLIVTLPTISTCLKQFNITSNSCWIDNFEDDSLHDILEKLSLVHITWTSVRGMTPTNSHVHGKLEVRLKTHPQWSLSNPICFTQSNSSTMFINAYLDTNPTRRLYKVTLKVWPTTCRLISNDALISLCWSIMTLLTTS